MSSQSTAGSGAAAQQQGAEAGSASHSGFPFLFELLGPNIATEQLQQFITRTFTSSQELFNISDFAEYQRRFSSFSSDSSSSSDETDSEIILGLFRELEALKREKWHELTALSDAAVDFYVLANSPLTPQQREGVRFHYSDRLARQVQATEPFAATHRVALWFKMACRCSFNRVTDIWDQESIRNDVRRRAAFISDSNGARYFFNLVNNVTWDDTARYRWGLNDEEKLDEEGQLNENRFGGKRLVEAMVAVGSTYAAETYVSAEWALQGINNFCCATTSNRRLFVFHNSAAAAAVATASSVEEEDQTLVGLFLTLANTICNDSERAPRELQREDEEKQKQQQQQQRTSSDTEENSNQNNQSQQQRNRAAFHWFKTLQNLLLEPRLVELLGTRAAIHAALVRLRRVISEPLVGSTSFCRVIVNLTAETSRLHLLALPSSVRTAPQRIRTQLVDSDAFMNELLLVAREAVQWQSCELAANLLQCIHNLCFGSPVNKWRFSTSAWIDAIIALFDVDEKWRIVAPAATSPPAAQSQDLQAQILRIQQEQQQQQQTTSRTQQATQTQQQQQDNDEDGGDDEEDETVAQFQNYNNNDGSSNNGETKRVLRSRRQVMKDEAYKIHWALSILFQLTSEGADADLRAHNATRQLSDFLSRIMVAALDFPARNAQLCVFTAWAMTSSDDRSLLLDVATLELLEGLELLRGFIVDADDLRWWRQAEEKVRSTLHFCRM